MLPWQLELIFSCPRNIEIPMIYAETRKWECEYTGNKETEHRGLLKNNFFINVEFKLSKSSNTSEGDHAFSVYTKSFKKLTFSYSLIRTRIGSVSFLDDFAYLLNEWSQKGNGTLAVLGGLAEYGNNTVAVILSFTCLCTFFLVTFFAGNLENFYY